MSNIKKLYEWYAVSRRREFIETHDKDEAWNMIQGRIQRHHRLVVARRWVGIAASVAVLMGVGLLLANSPVLSLDEVQIAAVTDRTASHNVEVKEEDGNLSVIVPVGAEFSDSLIDGTRIVMNAGTTIRYPKKFESGVREVEMSGEAYFEVAHVDDKPFRVHTSSGMIEVLGTHFNVLAEAEQTIVTLEEGSVRLRSGDGELVMKPGEQVCMRNGGLFDVRKVNTHNYTSWSTGVYDFTDASLEEIARQLSLWYGVNVLFDDDKLGQTRYTGVITRDEPLQNALNMLEVISNLDFTVRGETIEVKLN